jgi:nicotinamidase-related amidase
MSVALLLVDIQNDYFPGGRMELHRSDAAGGVAGRLLESFRERRLPIVHIQHISARPEAAFFRPGTPGVEIHPLVAPIEGETVIQKHYPNAFRDTPLLAHLQQQGITRLVIAGMMTHMCVDATVRAAVDHGFEVRTVRDACATKDLKSGEGVVPAAEVHAAFLAALDGTYGRVMTAEAVVEELEKEGRR